MTNRLFVYGTLQPEKAPAEIRKEVKKMQLLSKGTVWGKLVDLGAYPGAVLGKQYRKTIPGLVLALPDDPKVLERLDRYEEFFPDAPEQSLFVRRQVDVELEDRTRTSCWIYEWNRARTPSFAPVLAAETVQAAI